MTLALLRAGVTRDAFERSLRAAHARLRIRIEPHGSPGDNRIPAMVERVVFLGAAMQVMLRLAPGVPVQALVQNDGERPDLAQGTPVHAHLPAEALRYE